MGSSAAIAFHKRMPNQPRLVIGFLISVLRDRPDESKTFPKRNVLGRLGFALGPPQKEKAGSTMGVSSREPPVSSASRGLSDSGRFIWGPRALPVSTLRGLESLGMVRAEGAWLARRNWFLFSPTR